MTLEDAEKIAKAAECIHGNCDTCMSQFIDELNALFPQFHFIVTGTEMFEVVVQI